MKPYRTYYEGPGRYGRYRLAGEGMPAAEARERAREYRKIGIRARIQKATDKTYSIYLRQ